MEEDNKDFIIEPGFKGDDYQPVDKHYKGYFTNRVACINPTLGFYVNQESLGDNCFIDQDFANMSIEESTELAQNEFKEFVDNLRFYGVNVEVFDQHCDTPDSVAIDWFLTAKNQYFPNGVLMLAAMKSKQ
jgi:hypothetical protein